MSERVTVERQGQVLLIGLNRPEKRNAFDPQMIRELSDAYTRLAKDRALRCGVLWAEGPDFTAGLDLGAIAKNMPKELLLPSVPRGQVDPWGVRSAPCPKPVVTAVQGRCYTAGIELALCGQVTVAAEDARFLQYEVSRGMMPFGGGTARWPAAVGAQNAWRYLLTGDELDAQEALRIGLVQQVTAREDCRAAAFAIAEKIADQAPLAVQATLKNSRLGLAKGQAAAIKNINKSMLRILISKDLRRALKSFSSGKPAHFEGD